MGARNTKIVKFRVILFNLFQILRDKMQKKHIIHVKNGLFRFSA